MSGAGVMDALRIHFQERPWDLCVVITYALLLSSLVLATQVGNISAVLLVLFVPGYVLVAVLFPSNKEIDWIERIAISVGMSIAIVPLLSLLLLFTWWGIRISSVVALIATFTFLVGLAAWWRRMRLPAEDRLAATFTLSTPDWKEDALVDKALTIVLTTSIVIAAATLAYVVLAPPPAERFTEFYIVNATGVAGGFPTNLTVNEVGTINLMVHNREFADTEYEVRIDRATMEEYFNASVNRTMLRETSRTHVASLSLQLGNDGYWNRSYTFTFPSPGIYRIYFYLYKLPKTQDVYQDLFLTVRVRS